MIKPMDRTGSSANIAYYRERGGKVWASVLESAFDHRDGVAIPRAYSVYHVTVYGDRRGELATIKHQRSSGHGELAPRTVTRLVRQALEQKGD